MKKREVVIKKILNLVFPVECLRCEILGSYLCDRCFLNIKLNEDQHCLGCNKQTALFGLCASCRPDFCLDGVFVAVGYDDSIIHKLIWQLKFHYVEGMAEQIGRLMARYLRERHLLELLNVNNAEIVPVPLYSPKQRARGFNQSWAITQHLGALDSRLEPNNCLIRRRDTGSQLGHEKMERLTNVRDAFAKNQGAKVGKTAFLIDDVVTTGSTLNEAAAVLKDAGVEKVYGLVFARK